MIKLIILSILFIGLFACKSEPKDKPEGGIEITTADPAPESGLYRTTKVVQTSFRDYNAKEEVYSEVEISETKVIYRGYRDGKEITRKEGSYEHRKHAVQFLSESSGEYEYDIVANVTPQGFKMKHGRQVLVLTKVTP